MKKILLILFFLPLCVSAQFQDNFSDGDFTGSVTWSGTGTYFAVNNEVLQSNGPNSNGSTLGDTLYLSTPSTMMDSTEWSFLLDFDFNPTADNLVRIFIVSDSADLRKSLNGYYIEVGQTSADYIKFYKKTGTVASLLFTGTTSFPGNLKAKIKVTRDSTGNWNIYTDPTYTGISYISEGASFNENSFTSTSYFGVYCQYKTDSRFNQYFFDDFYVGSIIGDTILPTAQSATIDSTMTGLDVLFSENVGLSTSQNTGNYTLLGYGNPLTASRDTADLRKVHLTFSTLFAEGILYSLEIDNVRDSSGNIMKKDTLVFSKYDPVPYDIVINEIMANPGSSFDGFEYLELYNTKNLPVNLDGWNVEINGSNKPLTGYSIPGNGYLILADEDASSTFSPLGTFISYSSFSLSNDGARIILKNSHEGIIHYVEYNLSWYHNVKDEGGWSLEQVNPQNPCGEASNWRASNDIRGGSPGMVNSVLDTNNRDLNTPILVRASAKREDKYRVKIYFNEILDSASMNDTSKYYVEYSGQLIGNPISINLDYPAYKSAELFFADSFQMNKVYTLFVTDSMYDCVGNKISVNQTAKFGIPFFPTDSAALVINEVLADPKAGGVDFVEIYNRSDKVYDFADMNLSSLTESKNIINHADLDKFDNVLSLPGSYTVLCTDPEAVKSQYYTPNPYNFIEMESFPSLNNDGGTVILTNDSDLKVIDQMSYTDDMNYPLLNSADGVSLERVSYNRPASDITNWHSAAEPVGFGTPAYLNSQFIADTVTDGTVSLDLEIFSPDNDGYNDVLNIYCKSDTPGKMVNIAIYDSKGRLIKYLVRNELMSSESVYSWDGINENNLKANIGIYIVFVEMLGLDGKVDHFKKTVVLATKL